jgi:nicotinamide-nucleotide amidase
MRIALLAVGDELLLGDVVNSNAAWLGRRLSDAGFEVVASAVAADDVASIGSVLRQLLAEAEAVVVCGGLGPTSDDLTREALAALAGVRLRRDAGLERAVTRWYTSRGLPAPAGALRMADVPEGAAAVGNAAGIAPGVRLEIGGRLVVAVPGVPAEMRDMVERLVLPDLLARRGKPQAIVTRTVHVALLGEAMVAERLLPVADDIARAGVRLAYLAGLGAVQVRLTATAPDRQAADDALRPLVQRVRDLIGDAACGVDNETLDRTVHRLLAADSATVAVAESLTGGLLGSVLTDMAGSSKTFQGGVTAYATGLKASLLGVDPRLLQRVGAVDSAVARQMAIGVRIKLDATYGVATTGVAGPEAQDGRAPGTVHIAVAGPAGAVVRSLTLAGGRDRVRRLTVVHALDLLRRVLCGFAAPAEEQFA